MIAAFSFRAKPGREAELEALLNDPEAGRKVAKAMGAHRNLLLWQGDRMVRILEFHDTVTPVPLGELAQRDEGIRSFFKKIGGLTQPGFDPDDEDGMARFNAAVAMRVLYDVRLEPE